MNILILRESRLGEARVALTPKEVKSLTSAGHAVTVQDYAGMKVGFSDSDYSAAGAIIMHAADDDSTALAQLFAKQDIIVRVKRAMREREQIEAKLFTPKQILVGFLDPLDQITPHVKEWQAAGIEFYSLDTLNISAESPMNALAPMSRLTGKLAVRDALSKLHNNLSKNALIIGLGQAGCAAVTEAVAQGCNVYAAGTNTAIAAALGINPTHFLLLDKTAAVSTQQQALLPLLLKANIVIAATRQTGQAAPILITEAALAQMQTGSVVVDLARSEGGNVAGSANDKTITLENGVIITNNTGYPKKEPREASMAYAAALLAFLQSII